MHKTEDFLRKHQLALNKCINHENETRGLIIKEAYFGLADHIYHIDAGIITYTLPISVEEYEKLQVIDVTKQLQLLVKNSKVELSKNILKKKSSDENEETNELSGGIFNPCVNHKSRVLLYVRFEYRNIEKIFVYDHQEYPVITIPNDLL